MSQRSTSDPAAPTSDYLLLVCSNLARWDAIPDDTMDVDLAGHADLIEDLQHTGRLLHCSPLVTPHEGCEVAVRDERTIVSPEPVLATATCLPASTWSAAATSRRRARSRRECPTHAATMSSYDL